MYRPLFYRWKIPKYSIHIRIYTILVVMIYLEFMRSNKNCFAFGRTTPNNWLAGDLSLYGPKLYELVTTN